MNTLDKLAFADRRWLKKHRVLREITILTICCFFSLVFFGIIGTGPLHRFLCKSPERMFWGWTVIGIINLRIIVMFLLNTLKCAIEMSIIDERTGLYNNKFIDEAVKLVFARALRLDEGKERFFCSLLVDVDDFKKINDIYGYETGNMALRILAKRLKSLVRGDDFVLRYAGDEFLIIFTAHHPEVLLERAISKLSEKVSFFNQDAQEIVTSATVGFGKIEVSECDEPTEAYASVFKEANADLKMKKEKNKVGR